MPTPKTTRRENLSAIQIAIRQVRDARSHLREAGALKSVAALSRTLKSLQGAERHAIRMLNTPTE